VDHCFGLFLFSAPFHVANGCHQRFRPICGLIVAFLRARFGPTVKTMHSRGLILSRLDSPRLKRLALLEEGRVAVWIAPDFLSRLHLSLPNREDCHQIWEGEGLMRYYADEKPFLPPRDELISTFRTSLSTVLK